MTCHGEVRLTRLARGVARDPRRQAIGREYRGRLAAAVAHLHRAEPGLRDRGANLAGIAAVLRLGRRPHGGAAGGAGLRGRRDPPRRGRGGRPCHPGARPAAARASVDVFEPAGKALAGLTKRVKESFDPKGVLNPGRMWAGV